MEQSINFDKPKFEKFKKVYAKAIEDGKTKFVFEGKDILVTYAKYMIEYLDGILK